MAGAGGGGGARSPAAAAAVAVRRRVSAAAAGSRVPDRRAWAPLAATRSHRACRHTYPRRRGWHEAGQRGARPAAARGPVALQRRARVADERRGFARGLPNLVSGAAESGVWRTAKIPPPSQPTALSIT
jgi:hypothetical protein